MRQYCGFVPNDIYPSRPHIIESVSIHYLSAKCRSVVPLSHCYTCAVLPSNYLGLWRSGGYGENWTIDRWKDCQVQGEFKRDCGALLYKIRVRRCPCTRAKPLAVVDVPGGIRLDLTSPLVVAELSHHSHLPLVAVIEYPHMTRYKSHAFQHM